MLHRAIDDRDPLRIQLDASMSYRRPTTLAISIPDLDLHNDGRARHASGAAVSSLLTRTLAHVAKGDWPKSFVIPSVVLSLTAAGFLVWHVLDPAKKVDGWAITLIVIGFLPWLRTIFETVEFPGGGSVTWRKQVEADIEALQFLTANFLPGAERELLQVLASGVPVPVSGGGSLKDLPKRARPLMEKGLIVVKPNIAADAVLT